MLVYDDKNFVGFHCLPNWTLYDGKLSVPERQLLSYVYMRARMRRWCWFKEETALKELELPRRSFYRAKQKLVTKGLVKVLATRSSITDGKGISIYAVPDRLAKRAAPIPIPETFEGLPKHLTVLTDQGATGGTLLGQDQGATGGTSITDRIQAMVKNTTLVKSKAAANSVVEKKVAEGCGYGAAAGPCSSLPNLTVGPDSFESTLLAHLGGQDAPKSKGRHAVDGDAPPEREKQKPASACAKPPRVRRDVTPQKRHILWHHWYSRMMVTWGAGRVSEQPTGPDIGNMKVILDQCGGDIEVAKKMVDIFVLDWAAIKTKYWQMKKEEFPTMGLMRQLRERLYARAYDNKGVTDDANRVSPFDREELKKKQLADPKAEYERRKKEWAES